MKCHHCRHDYPETWDEIYIGKDTLDRDESYHDRDQQRTWLVRKVKCPECKKLIIVLREVRGHFDAEGPELRDPTHILGDKLIRPEQASKEPLPSEVPSELAEDYYEACRVLPISAKASAALSRRCLQNFLREVVKVKPDDLATEIKEVLENLISR